MKNNKSKVVLAISLAVLLLILLVSACNTTNLFGDSEDETVVSATILALTLAAWL